MPLGSLSNYLSTAMAEEPLKDNILLRNILTEPQSTPEQGNLDGFFFFWHWRPVPTLLYVFIQSRDSVYTGASFLIRHQGRSRAQHAVDGGGTEGVAIKDGERNKVASVSMTAVCIQLWNQLPQLRRYRHDCLKWRKKQRFLEVFWWGYCFSRAR